MNKDVALLTPEIINFHQTIDGKEVGLFVLQKHGDFAVAVTNYGARVVSIITKDASGESKDVVMGFDNLEQYIKSDEKYHGAVVGRYANRIAQGKFSIEGQEYILPINNGLHHLHGGIKGFHDVVWTVDEVNPDSIILSYLSQEKEEGYPGNLHLTVIYTVTDENALRIRFRARTDKATVINVTNHAYFNLNGQGSGDILNHQLMINALQYTPVDETLIPSGNLASVEETPFDFRKADNIGRRIHDDDQQLKYGGGYDHNFVLNKKDGELDLAAIATGDISGITLEVYTTEPGLQLYTGNFMKGANKMKQGMTDIQFGGFCLETQHFPDSPNKPHFPSTLLNAGEEFQSETIFRFTTKGQG
ncbi:MAG TPA: aldose epimerase family protein [Chitinophagaceae bacterium]